MPRFRASRPTIFLAVLLLLAASFVFFSPHHDRDSFDPSFLADSTVGHLPNLEGVRHPESWWSYFAPTTAESGVPIGLEYGSDGLVRGWDQTESLLDSPVLSKSDKKKLKAVIEKHPILELIDRAKKRWENLLARQSRTLPQAVTEYTRRYNRPPPKGFEEWWQFCKRNKVKIVDDYDQINRDIEPFLGISPELFRKRDKALMETAHSYQINLSPTSASSISGERAMSARGKLLYSLLEPIAQYLPSDMTMHISDHDLGSWLLGDDQHEALLSAVREKRFMTEDDLKPYEKKEGRSDVKGTVSACPKDSPAWQMALDKQAGVPIEAKSRETSFIYDHRPTFDFCSNTDILSLHGSLSFDFARDTTLRPIFQLSKFSRNAEFLTTPLEAYENHTSVSAQKKFVPWEDKTINKLFWRGSSTGDSYSKRKNYDWRRSHRPRLHLMAQATEGQREIWAKRGKEWDRESWGNGKLNEAYMDVGFTGKPHQCKQEDGTCDEMARELVFKDRVQPEQAAKFKYVLDVDGNGWSSRFHRLITSGSVVVKSTIYPEWHSDWLTPWVHYIPTQVDYSDLYSIMSFFVGSPEGRTEGNDGLAAEIAEQGKKFGEEHWRWEDMQAYMFRLLLEYARLQADDRDAWSYGKTY
ncbi:hypothetical protein P7C73_g2946, partial [Tremellales sp. Uapishka_1]